MSSLELLNDCQVSLDEKMRFCQIIARSSFVPKAFQNKPEDVFLAICFGSALGLAPLQALQCIAVINGKPCIWGDGLLAVCASKPDFEYIKECWNEELQEASCCVKMKNAPEHVVLFSMTDAKAAGLAQKPGPWQTYKKRMCQMRARGFALRDTCAHHLMGIISREEAEDYNTTWSHVEHSEPSKTLAPPYDTQNFELLTNEQKQTIVNLLNKLSFSEERKEKMLAHYQVDSVAKLTIKQANEVVKFLDIEDIKTSEAVNE